jgi:hypothetical protein
MFVDEEGFAEAEDEDGNAAPEPVPTPGVVYYSIRIEAHRSPEV